MRLLVSNALAALLCVIVCASAVGQTTTTAASTPPPSPAAPAPATAAPPAKPPADATPDGPAAKHPGDMDEKFRSLRRERVGIIRRTEEIRTQLISLRDGLTRKEERLQRLKEQTELNDTPSSLLESSGPSVADVKQELANVTKNIADLRASLDGKSDAERKSADSQIQELTTRERDIRRYIESQTRREEFEKRRQQQATERRAKLEVDTKAAVDEVKLDQATAQNLVKELNEQLVKQGTIEDELNDVLKTETQRNQFKTTIALFFAFLVALVIAGFFVLSYRDDIVRRAIFSSESGIQFLTLFSVVIAIILFGIIGILESKELAALLGGLSGYILGRVTTAHARHPAAP